MIILKSTIFFLRMQKDGLKRAISTGNEFYYNSFRRDYSFLTIMCFGG